MTLKDAVVDFDSNVVDEAIKPVRAAAASSGASQGAAKDQQVRIYIRLWAPSAW